MEPKQIEIETKMEFGVNVPGGLSETETDGKAMMREDVTFVDKGKIIEIHNPSGKIATVPDDLTDSVRNFPYGEVYIGGVQPGLNNIQIVLKK